MVTVDRKSIASSLLGHLIERYDVALYGCLATVMSIHYFPTGNKDVAMLASFGTFAAGYFMRPLGGILFGSYGDRYGRKKAFLLSVGLTIIPTTIMGLLPTYAEIGIAASVIIFACRLAQGLCVGGEFGGVGVYIGEHVPANRVGFSASFVCAFGILGAVFGTALGSFCIAWFMPAWGWRLPFLIGALATLGAYFIRRRMQETPVFKQIEQSKTQCHSPLRTVLKQDPWNILCALGVGGCGHSLLYVSTLYLNDVYINKIGLTLHESLMVNTLIFLYWVLLSPVMGYISDRFDLQNFMQKTSLCILFLVFPLFFMLDKATTFYGTLIFQVLFSTLGVAFVAPISGLFTRLFPPKYRYTGVAFGITLGQAILGGTTPLICIYLAKSWGSLVAPGVYIFITTVIGFLSVTFLRRYDDAVMSFQQDTENRCFA
ncbi:MFS transporter [Candidatus Finniella inopinata]|nr:MFS transporter [Candidatus Finniella inopinata]